MEGDTIEKKEQLLQSLYGEALRKLYQGECKEGLRIMREVLESSLLEKMEVLRHSALLSAAELEDKVENNTEQAIKLLYRAIKIKEDYTLWKKLGDLCVRGGHLGEGEFCLRKAIGSSPILTRNYLVEGLIEVKILQQRYQEALEIVNRLIEGGFAVERQRTKKLFCLRKMGVKSNEITSLQSQVSLEFLPKYDEMRQEILKRPAHSNLPTKLVERQPPIGIGVSHWIDVNIRGESSWHSLVGQVYLLMKYHIVATEQKKRVAKAKYRGLEEYFSSLNLLNSFIKINRATTTVEKGSKDKSLSFCETFLSVKRRKNKDSSPRISIDDQQKKYIQVVPEGNIKDWLSNSTIQIDSLVRLQAKFKEKDLSKVTVLNQLNRVLFPSKDFFQEYLDKVTQSTDTIEVMNSDKSAQKGSESKPIEIEDCPEERDKDEWLEDFNSFSCTVLKKSYPNISELSRELILYFLTDRPNEKGLGPHPVLSSEDYIIKPLLVKMFQMSHRLSANLFPQNQLLLPILELMVERYGDISRKVSKQKDKVASIRHEKELIRKILVEVEQRLFGSNYSHHLAQHPQKTQMQSKLRIYHSLAIFYSYHDQQILSFVHQMTNNYHQTLDLYKASFNLEEVQRSWLRAGPTKSNLSEFVESRLKENSLKKDVDQKGSSLSNALSVSIQNFRKHKERQVGEALQLYYRNIMDLLSEVSTYSIFLKHVADILEIYLQILDKKPLKQDYSRYILKIDDLMKVDEVASLLIRRTNQQDKRDSFELMQPMMRLTMILSKATMQRLLLVESEQQGNNNVFKSLLCTLTYLLRHLKEEVQLVPGVVLFVHEVAHFPSDSSNVHKKFNLHFLPKYIQQLLKDKRVEEREETQPGEFNYRNEVEDVLGCYYDSSSRRITEFAPQTQLDVENFVRYLKCFRGEYFKNPSLKIKQAVNTVLRESRDIQKKMMEERGFCDSLRVFKEKLAEWYTRNKFETGFVELLTDLMKDSSKVACPAYSESSELCPACFCRVKEATPALLDINYLIARSLQNQQVTGTETSKQNIQRGIRKAQRIYLQLVCLDTPTAQYWYCLSKINKKKAFTNFDETVNGVSTNEWKHGFLASKRIAALMKQNLFLSPTLCNSLEEDILILNLLKVYERKLLYLESKINELPEEEERRLKMIDAYQTVISRTDPLETIKNQRILYLFLVHCKYPYIMHTNFSSRECVNILRPLKGLCDRNQVEGEEGKEMAMRFGADELYLEILFIGYEMLEKSHAAVGWAQSRCVQTLPLLYEHMKVLLELLSSLLPVLERQLSENNPSSSCNLFQTAAEKLSTQYNSSHPRQQQFSWIQFLHTACSPISFNFIESKFNTVISNLKLQIQSRLDNIQAKKARSHRYYVNCKFYLSRLIRRFENNPKEAFACLNEVINIKSDDVVMLYRYYENQSLERDPKLAEFFNRNLFFFINRNSIIIYLISLLWENQQHEKLMVLYKKFLKAAPKEDGTVHNRIFGLLYQVMMKGVVQSLSAGLKEGVLGEESERWMLEVYDKNVRQRKPPKELQPKIKQLVLEYYRASEKYEQLSSTRLELDMGRALLEEKWKQRKPSKESKPTTAPTLKPKQSNY